MTGSLLELLIAAKNLTFLVRKVTIFASIAPIFSQFSWQWLETFTVFAPMAPNCSLFPRQWLRPSKYGAIDMKMTKSLESFMQKLKINKSRLCKNCDNIGAIDGKIDTFLTRRFMIFQNLED